MGGAMESPGWLVIILLIFLVSGCIFDLKHDSVITDQQDIPANPTESYPQKQAEDVMPQDLVSAEIAPIPSQANQAALALQRLGFRILHIGPTISVQAPRSLWESTFNVSFQVERKTTQAETNSETTYLRAITDDLVIPEGLEGTVSEVFFVEPPEFYQGQP
jgi:hypothetical protein